MVYIHQRHVSLLLHIFHHDEMEVCGVYVVTEEDDRTWRWLDIRRGRAS
jgi:hypothetical protein